MSQYRKDEFQLQKKLHRTFQIKQQLVVNHQNQLQGLKIPLHHDLTRFGLQNQYLRNIVCCLSDNEYQ